MACGAGIEAGAATRRTRFGQAARRAGQLFEQRPLLFEDLASRARTDETRARRIRRGADADDQAARARMGIDDPRAGARSTLLVQDFEPFAVVERAQRLGRHALEAPGVLFAAARHRRIFEGHGQALGTRLVLLGFGLQRGAQRCGEAAPATSGEAGEVLLECVDARVGFELIRVLGRQRNAFGAYDDADGARLTIGRPRVLGHLRNLAGHEVAVAQRARELEMQLRKTQRQTLTRRPAAGCGPHNKCVGCDGLTQTSEAGFDRSSSETPHIVRLAVEPHPGGQRRANLRR